MTIRARVSEQSKKLQGVATNLHRSLNSQNNRVAEELPGGAAYGLVLHNLPLANRLPQFLIRVLQLWLREKTPLPDSVV